MIPLFNVKCLPDLKSTIELPLQCEFCKEIFHAKVKTIRRVLANTTGSSCKFCTDKCYRKSVKANKSIVTICGQCEKIVQKPSCVKNSSKSGNIFCSRSCAAIYNNAHKTKGTRRSKLEIWLEEQLKSFYPTLEFISNNKEIINSELDIYIPSLKLAFELNGIVHYEPIYGSEKLSSIKNNDNRKFQACLEKNIELVIIDSSGLKYFKPEKAQKYLDIIKSIIDSRTIIPTMS